MYLQSTFSVVPVNDSGVKNVANKNDECFRGRKNSSIMNAGEGTVRISPDRLRKIDFRKQRDIGYSLIAILS